MRKILMMVFVSCFMNITTVWGIEPNIAAFLRVVELSAMTEVMPEKLALFSFKGLSDIDRRVIVANDRLHLSLYVRGRLIKRFPKPEDGDFKSWGKMIDLVLNEALSHSPTLRLKDFELVDAMMKRMTEVLDKDSKFYPSMDQATEADRGGLLSFAARMEDNVLYVYMGVFGENTVAELTKALKQYDKAKALVLDVRGNGGGNLKVAGQVADLFLDDVILFMVNKRNERDNVIVQASKSVMFRDKPIFILVDKNTASAAEIMAGSLQEQSRAKLVGTPTYGKGTSQILLPLETGSVLALTNARITLPSEKDFNGIGLRPDYCATGYGQNVQLTPLTAEKSCEKVSREGEDGDVLEAVKLLQNLI